MFLARLNHRHLEPEVMDRPDLDPGQHVRALRGLARINRFSASDRILWAPLRRLALDAGRPLRVLDVATGGGDVPIRLWQRATRAGLPIELHGADLSLTAVDHARANARRAGAAVEFFRLDVLHEAPPTGFDAITTSLFLHHLTDDEAVALLRALGAAAGRAVLVNDLVRSRFGYLLARVGTHLLSRSPVVHIDGPRSVAAAFTVAEARALADRAGLIGATFTRHWPARFRMEWRRPA